MPLPAIACHNKPLREKAVVLCIAAAVHLGPAGMANARLVTEELMLPIAHFGTAVSAGAASSAMTDHCQEIYDEFRGTAVFIDYEIDTTSTYTFVEIAVAGEVIKMTAHPIKAHYKFFSNKLPDHLSSLGAQAVIFRINIKFKQPSVEIRFSSNNRYECHLIASAPK